MELADVLDSKSSGSDTVRVRPPPPAPKSPPHPFRVRRAFSSRVKGLNPVTKRQLCDCVWRYPNLILRPTNSPNGGSDSPLQTSRTLSGADGFFFPRQRSEPRHEVTAFGAVKLHLPTNNPPNGGSDSPPQTSRTLSGCGGLFRPASKVRIPSRSDCVWRCKTSSPDQSSAKRGF